MKLSTMKVNIRETLEKFYLEGVSIVPVESSPAVHVTPVPVTNIAVPVREGHAALTSLKVSVWMYYHHLYSLYESPVFHCSNSPCRSCRPHSSTSHCRPAQPVYQRKALTNNNKIPEFLCSISLHTLPDSLPLQGKVSFNSP